MSQAKNRWKTDKDGIVWVQSPTGTWSVAPEHKDAFRQDVVSSIEKLEKLGNDLLSSSARSDELRALSDAKHASTAALESDLAKTRELFRKFQRAIPFSTGGTSLGGSDLATGLKREPERAVEPLGGPGLMPLFVKDVLGKSDSKDDEGLTAEQKHFLAKLRARR
jgi:hypothetical protein